MSEVQAKETDDKTDETVLLDQEVDKEIKPDEEVDTDELEIVVDEEVKPTSRRLTGFEKRLRKKDGQIDQANAEAEALREENKLLRLSQQQKLEQLTEPVEDTFDDPVAYRAALRAYDKQENKALIDSEVQAHISKAQQHNTQENSSLKEQQDGNAHYERVDKLNLKNYDELEGKAADILTDDFCKTLIANTDKAHLILPYLGANPGKAIEIANMIKTNPVKAFAMAVEIGAKQLTQPKQPTPLDPETQLDPGSSISQSEKKLDAMVQKVSDGTATPDQLRDLRKKVQK